MEFQIWIDANLPPFLIWLTYGNTSKDIVQDILTKLLPQALTLLKNGDTLVEIY